MKENQGVFYYLIYSLRKTFFLLKLFVFSVLMFFIVSGFYSVDEGNIAIHLRFGEILGENEKGVVSPGGPYFALPYPLDEIVYLPTTIQEVSLEDAFWMGDPLGIDYNKLDPKINGYLLTGDKNIVHAWVSASFQIRADQKTQSIVNPILFYKNIGNIENAKKFVLKIVENALVTFVSSQTIDDFYSGNIDYEMLKNLVQDHLDILNSGISLLKVSIQKRSVPSFLLDDFKAVNRAESEKAQAIEIAEKERADKLNQLAGSFYNEIIKSIYLFVEKEGMHAKTDQKNSLFNNLFENIVLGGEVSQILEGARTYRNQTLNELKTFHDRLEKLKEAYEENPSLFKERHFQQVLETIFTKDSKKILYSSELGKELFIDLSAKTMF